jgi:deazaflavin-dependent oxidoreductase (nitroreductase family)
LQYLYLTTRGRRTGLPREIEIWFTELKGRYYVIAEQRENAQWVKNIQQDARVLFRVGEQAYKGYARIVDADREPDLCAQVQRLSEAKYGWGDGLIVELTPESE